MSSTNFKFVFVRLFESKRASACLLLCLLFLSAQATVKAAGAGSLDLTFGAGGKALTSFDGLNANFSSKIALQTDGKIVTAGSVLTGFFNPRICLTRHNPNGSLDTSFGTNGKVITDLARSSDVAGQVAIQPDGKIVVAGYTADFNAKGSVYDLAVLRYDSNGSLDASFDGDGIKIIDTGSYEEFTDAAIQPDGKILAAGTTGQGATVVRLNADGSLDPTFSGDGIAGTLIPNFQGYFVTNVALQPDGAVIISGSENFTTWFMIRYNANGSLDTRFDQDGIVVTVLAPTGVESTGLALQADGKIVIAGFMQPAINANRSNIALARYESNGSLDASFGTSGKVFTHVGANNRNDEGADVALQPDGKILVLANVNQVPLASPPNALWGLLRYNADGSLDPTFSGDGVATTTVTGRADFASSMLIQPDGKILAGGKTGNPSVFALLRFSAAAQSPFDYDGDTKTDVGIYRPSTGAWWITRSSTNATNAQEFGIATDKIVPGDYTGDGKADIAVWRPSTGTWFIVRSENNSFYGFEFGASSDIPAPGDYDGDGKTDAAVFRPSNASWYILRSSDGAVTSLQFGISEDKPVAADYDGDGKTDIGVFRPTPAEWWILKSSGGVFSVQFGQTGDQTVPGDYTGDGKADIAVFRPSNGYWYVIRSEDFSFYGFPFGGSSDAPTPGDYDGDGRTDAAVFRPSNSSWYLLRSTAGFIGLQFGISGDQPIPNAFVR